MNFRRLTTRNNLILLLISVILVLVTAGYFFFSKPPRLPMEKYAPASALAIIEIDSLTDLLNGLTGTGAWREIAPVLGLSSQLKQLGSGLDLASRTGLGPDEAVIAGRSQYAIVVTGVEANAVGPGDNDEGMSLQLKPRFTLVAETHASAEKAARIVNDRASIIATRIFGDSTRTESKDYQGGRLLIYRGKDENRQLVAASVGSVVLIGNHEDAVAACLDAIANRTATLEQDEVMKLRRKEVGASPAIFAYVTQSGLEKFAQLAPAIFATRVTSDPDRISAIAGLTAHLSKQAFEGFFYGLEFAGDGVTERYLTVMRPEMAAGFKAALKPAGQTDFNVLQLIPADAADFTIFNVEAAGAIPERTLKTVSPSLDIVASLALREFVLNLRTRLGLEGGETLERAIGNELAVVKLGEDEPTVLIASIKDRNALQQPLNRYLTKDKASVSSAAYKGIERLVSTNEDKRAAAFVDSYLVLGTPGQIERVIDARSGSASARNDVKLRKALDKPESVAPIVSCETDEKQAAEMMLTVSKLTRVTDGAPELLDRDAIRSALTRLPHSTSYTQFHDYGVYSEARSAVGVFKRLAGWLD